MILLEMLKMQKLNVKKKINMVYLIHGFIILMVILLICIIFLLFRWNKAIVPLYKKVDTKIKSCPKCKPYYIQYFKIYIKIDLLKK